MRTADYKVTLSIRAECLPDLTEAEQKRIQEYLDKCTQKIEDQLRQTLRFSEPGTLHIQH